MAKKKNSKRTTMKAKNAICVLVLFYVSLIGFAQSDSINAIWNIKELYKAPKFTYTEIAAKEGVKSIFYNSLPYLGKQTKVYAYYSLPNGKSPKDGWPAVVCVHGGGGTGFAEWVKIWNNKGYVAIAMDLEGHIPSVTKTDEREMFDGSGPQRMGVFDDWEKPIENQWYYHAVAQIIIAHSFIRSLPEVNPEKTGITGISWGGMLTSLVSGIDNRFKFAIPVYGCGFLQGTDGKMGDEFSKGGQYFEHVLKNWEASAYLPKAQMPMLFINGTNDAYFPLKSTMKSAESIEGDPSYLIIKEMNHSHKSGWAPKEIYAYADHIIKGERPLPKPGIPEISDNMMSFNLKNLDAIKSVKILYTTDSKNIWPNKKWEVKEINDTTGVSIKVKLPPLTIAAYYQVENNQGLIGSSKVLFLTVL